MSQQDSALVEVTSESSQDERNNVRNKLSTDIEAFLSNGGRVQKIADNVRADPPKKPNMTYGSAPI